MPQCRYAPGCFVVHCLDLEEADRAECLAESLGSLAELRALADRRVDDARRDLQGPLSVVDDNQKVVGALSVVGATKMTKNKHYMTNILLKCIDDSIDSQLGFSVVNNDRIYIDETENLTARSYASLMINKQLSIAEQEDLVKRMNLFILERRKEYNSLFLTNYRESNTIARKRISFDLASDRTLELLELDEHAFMRLSPTSSC